MPIPETTLYARLRGYDGIAALVGDLGPRLVGDARLGRFWQHRGEDGVRREVQLLVNFLCTVSGGPMVYTGRDMTTSHKGMRIDEGDWQVFTGHLAAALASRNVGAAEQSEVLAFIAGTKGEIVE